jgi:hypothetical protein
MTDRPGPPATWPTLDVLACPLCASPLRPGDPGGLVCGSCGSAWPERDGWLDFRPPPQSLDAQWHKRQRSMEAWYENLITNSDQAEWCWRHDYEPLRPLLAGLRGVVLDVGGGNGVTRQYLDESVDYIDLDPSVEWLREDWLAVSEFFPALVSPITFVRASARACRSARPASTPCSCWPASTMRWTLRA